MHQLLFCVNVPTLRPPDLYCDADVLGQGITIPRALKRFQNIVFCIKIAFYLEPLSLFSNIFQKIPRVLSRLPWKTKITIQNTPPYHLTNKVIEVSSYKPLNRIVFQRPTRPLAWCCCNMYHVGWCLNPPHLHPSCFLCSDVEGGGQGSDGGFGMGGGMPDRSNSTKQAHR